MSKLRDWKGSKQLPRTSAEHERIRQWEAMSPEEKRAVQREQLVSWLEKLMGEEPILRLNNEAQPHRPITQEEADFRLELFDNEAKSTPEIRIELAQFELLRWPDHPRIIYKYWKLTFPQFFRSAT